MRPPIGETWCTPRTIPIGGYGVVNAKLMLSGGKGGVFSGFAQVFYFFFCTPNGGVNYQLRVRIDVNPIFYKDCPSAINVCRVCETSIFKPKRGFMFRTNILFL